MESQIGVTGSWKHSFPRRCFLEGNAANVTDKMMPVSVCVCVCALTPAETRPRAQPPPPPYIVRESWEEASSAQKQPQTHETSGEQPINRSTRKPQRLSITCPRGCSPRATWPTSCPRPRPAGPADRRSTSCACCGTPAWPAQDASPPECIEKDVTSHKVSGTSPSAETDMNIRVWLKETQVRQVPAWDTGRVQIISRLTWMSSLDTLCWNWAGLMGPIRALQPKPISGGVQPFVAQQGSITASYRTLDTVPAAGLHLTLLSFQPWKRRKNRVRDTSLSIIAAEFLCRWSIRPQSQPGANHRAGMFILQLF